MKEYDFIVLGGMGCHYILKVDTIHRDDITCYVQNENFDELFFGGTGLNIAYNLAKLGERCVLATTIQGPTLEKYEKVLDNIGISKEGLHYIQDQSKGIGLIIEDENKNRLTLSGKFNQGERTPHPMDDALFEKSRMAILSIDNKDNILAFLDKLKKHKLPFAFSMRSDTTIFTKEVLTLAVPAAEVVFCNNFEKSIILDALGVSDITALFDYGSTKVIAVTDGKNGSDIWVKEAGGVSAYHIETSPTQGDVDCTGAGDAYVAGFMHGYCHHKTPVECAQLGSTLSSFIIEKCGCITNSPSKESLYKRLITRKDCIERNLNQ